MNEIDKRSQSLFDLSATCTGLNKKVDASLSFHGISFTEFTVLSELHRAPYQLMRRIDLADATKLTASGITRLLNPMEKTGLVVKQKNERDARMSLVKLTEAGHQVFLDAMKTYEHCAERLTQALTPDEVNTLVNLLNKMRQ